MMYNTEEGRALTITTREGETINYVPESWGIVSLDHPHFVRVLDQNDNCIKAYAVDAILSIESVPRS